MNRPSSLLLGLSIASLGLAACGDDAPPPSEVRTRISTDLVHVLAEAEAASAGGAALPSAASFGLVDRALGGVLDSALGDADTTLRLGAKLSRISGLLAPRGDLASTGERTERSLLAPSDPVEDDFDGEAAAQWLNDNLFTDANHQGNGIYKVPAALACTETQYDGSGAPIGEAVDPECAQAFAQIQLRIRVSEHDDVLRFALQLGPNHDEPLEVGLAAQALSLTVDLDEAEDVVRSFASQLGEGLPSFSLTGQATAKLEILGAAHARGSLDIDRAVAIRFAEAGGSLAGPDAFGFASAKTNLLAITVDGNASSSAIVLGLGATTLHVPDGDGAIELDLPGASLVAMHTAGAPLQLTHVGLGDRTTSLSIGGAPAISIDLNPADGRAFGATITHDPVAGTETLTVAPRFDLRTQIDHAVLGEPAPVYDVTQVVLDGSLRSTIASDRLEVLTGSLALATNPASYGFTASAGQCVTGTEVVDAATDRFYTQWTTGSCQ